MEGSDLPPVEPDKAREAIVRLLDEHGVPCAHDDLIVKEVISDTGRHFYVGMARNGCEQAVAEAIAPLTPRSASPGVFGVWVLRTFDVRPLLEKVGIR